MTILKYLILFLGVYFIINITYWGYQEYVNYEDMQTVRSLGNKINIARVTIEEKEETIAKLRRQLDKEKVKLDKLVNDKKFAQYNEYIGEYNELVNNLNEVIKEYDVFIELNNKNVKIVNDLIVKSGTRKYLFPIDTYTPELYREIN
ncbi:hypothetical protein EBU71_02745 [bacterium]|nr:hypothetical protein [Candidatus Elulimicrobium humile]